MLQGVGGGAGRHVIVPGVGTEVLIRKGGTFPCGECSHGVGNQGKHGIESGSRKREEWTHKRGKL